MARPFKTPTAVLQRCVDDYFDLAVGDGEFPSEAGLILYMIKNYHGERYADRGDILFGQADYEKLWLDKDYKPVLEMAKLRRKDWLERKMCSEPRAANGCLNALRQEENGSYKDRGGGASADKPRKLTIHMEGVGKNAAG